jgi:hypothetical protein
MTPVQDYAAIFADARDVHAQALERLEHGDIRDAAEKAWCATKRATDALILARTGELPATTASTSRGLRRLASEAADIESLVGRYYTRIGHLHGECFYDGMCDPVEDTERRIRETSDYIRDAEALTRTLT